MTLEFRDLDAAWARSTLQASSGLLDQLRLNWLADAEVSLTPNEPDKFGLSLFFTDPFELAAALRHLPLPLDVGALENWMRTKFDFAPRAWIKLHVSQAQIAGISQYFVIDPRLDYPITTLRMGLRALGLQDTSRIEPAFGSVLAQPESLWAVIAKRSGAAVRPRLSCFVLASSVQGLLNDLQASGYASEHCVQELLAVMISTCSGDDRVYVSLDPDHVDAISIDFQVADQTPRPPELEDLWGGKAQRRYLKLRVGDKGRSWTLYRPFAEMVCPPRAIPAAKSYYDQHSEQVWDAFGDTYQAGPFMAGRSLADRLAIEAGARVLDAGCGAGGPAIELARAGAEVVGVTISSVQAALASRAVKAAELSHKITVAAADYHQLPFTAGSFERVMFMESIGYADLQRVLNEARRVLLTGGLIYIKDPLVVDRELTPEEEFELAEFDRLYGQATPSVAQVGQALHDAGFAIVACRCIDDEVDTGSFHQRMFDSGGLSPFGQKHYRSLRRLPVSFYEIIGRKTA
jgi:cyclopropane fatty-acyl-phospholipid synthase-like methyltransferase